MQSAEFVIIGGGLIGLATAYQLALAGRQVVLLEKEADIATQQSGQTGILHSAIHVRPNSLAAQHIRYGGGMLRTFCRQESIPLQQGNQLFVASETSDLPNLKLLKQQGLLNGIQCDDLSAEQIPEIEPYATGIAGLVVRDVPTVNFQHVAQRLALRIEMMGGQVCTHEVVQGIRTREGGVVVKSSKNLYVAQYVINAAGSYAERVANLAGYQSNYTLVPFRGEYMQMKLAHSYQCKHLIFPVPNLDMPFLGIHMARLGIGRVLCGPNAILAGGQNQHRKGQISLRTSLSHFTSLPIRRLSRRYFQTALWEQRRSWSKGLFTLTLQQFVPTLEKSQLSRTTGGTQQYAITSAGEFVNDFVIESAERITHILSTPNFGATACLSIGQAIAEQRMNVSHN